MRDQDNETISGELADAIELLRQKPVVRAEWRDELLRRAQAPESDAPPASAAGAPAAHRRRVSLSVPWALAAGIACALLGASAAMLVRRPAPAPASVVAEQHVAESAAVMLPVRFSLAAPSAARVSIVGDFNDWNPIDASEASSDSSR